jgi:succinate dehydrogenase / fumarate reductase iron-sulfur subunit
LHAEITEGAESRMSEKDRDKIDQYVGCILCALCYAACPVVSMNEDFTGPAALAKLYRFVADSREDRGPAALEPENVADGMWGCHTVTRCIQACPKNIRPTDGIEGVRRRLLSDKFKGLLGKK